MTGTTGTGGPGAAAPTDPEAHGGPSLSSMSGTASGAAPNESPAGPGETGDEWREPVDSVGATPGAVSRALRAVREHAGVTAGIVVVVIATIAVLALRRR
jgi:hypothetical protein